MLRFSRKADYGLMAVHYIAFHQHDGVVSAKRIAEDLGIPSELLAKILQRLAKGKLIASDNGPKGGYVLARDPGQIRVGEVLRAIEGPLGMVSCYRTMTSARSSSAATSGVRCRRSRAASSDSWRP